VFVSLSTFVSLVSRPLARGRLRARREKQQLRVKKMPSCRRRWSSGEIQRFGPAFIAGAVLLFGLKVSIFKALNEYNPLVFDACNILCASNTVGLLTSALFLRHDLSVDKARAIPRGVWLWMAVGAVMASIIGPLFSNLGWATASVSTVSVLEKSQSVFVLLAQPVMSRCKKLPSRWDSVNALLTTTGIVLTFVSAAVFFGGRAGISVGEFYIIISSLCFTCSLLISKTFLTEVPPGILTIFRLSLGTVSYHVINLARGSANYSKLWTGELWLHMLYYGIFFVTVPQQCWLQATNTCSKPLLSTGINSQFAVQIVFGMIILQSFPTPSVLVGGTFILASIISAVVKANYGDDAKASEDDEGDELGADYTSLAESGGGDAP
jgi:drug/metabolite transporter (DMT)-like permease